MTGPQPEPTAPQADSQSPEPPASDATNPSCVDSRESLFSRSCSVLDGSVASAQLAPQSRWGLGLLGGALLAMLIAARVLTPNPDGLGTHQQLGLPPCNSLVLFGVRCPSCGMTTSWTYVLRGEMLSALEANASGALLALLAMVVAPWALISAGRGRVLWEQPGKKTLLLVGSVVIALALAQWVWRLAAN